MAFEADKPEPSGAADRQVGYDESTTEVPVQKPENKNPVSSLADTDENLEPYIQQIDSRAREVLAQDYHAKFVLRIPPKNEKTG
ncbi:MAG: hypothetical protein MI748_04330 [Opitutales bacterium]|nr:hypothetical protein [Opitutales bacterium]